MLTPKPDCVSSTPNIGLELFQFDRSIIVVWLVMHGQPLMSYSLLTQILCLNIYFCIIFFNTILKVCTNDKGLSNRGKRLFRTGTLDIHMRLLIFGRPQKMTLHPNVQTCFHNS